ncbi:MAG TPA: P-II family nitrogen regulator [Fimbriimonadaceae bacterium]|nr:P-II family nitrogen regulator [Fimbriimonadaceae bacterium]
MIVRVTAYLRSHRLEDAKTAVSNVGVNGLTVTDVRGSGSSPERASTLAGQDILIALPLRSKLEVVVPEELTEPVIEAILGSIRTDEPGDGKVFVEPVTEVVRIRTGERGLDAV